MDKPAQNTVAGWVALGVLALSGQSAWQVARGLGPVDVEQVRSAPPVFVVDLNRAEAAELSLLPQVGDELARRILLARRRVGGFTRVEDLLQVRGIGPKKLAQMRPFLIVVSRASG